MLSFVWAALCVECDMEGIVWGVGCGVCGYCVYCNILATGLLCHANMKVTCT